MKVLLSWLREFAPFDGDPVALGNTMSGLGMAVEDLVHIGANLDGIVVARVLEVRPHPSADRIQLVDVDAGDGNALQICCGAFNMAAGDLVPLATLGTTMSDGRTIERRKLRGQWSNGMLCSARELEMSDDADGILILDARFTPGAALADALEVERDVLYDLDLTGNRPDALSVAGIARDLAAKLGVPFSIPDPVVVEQGSPIAGRVTVTILDAGGCGRFVARILDNVRIEPSPPHIANRLTLCGMRPINNVVDVSNYVMLELGRPNHTFDLRKLANGSATPGIRVRRARDGERIVTLDDVERELIADDLLICDQDDRPVGIAGVMGGADTEIDDATTSVLLEMAWFDPDSIASTARRLGLRSEASIRFERGTDYDHLELCARRFAELVAPSGFTLAPGIVDARGTLPSRTRVRVRPAKVNALLGIELSGAEMCALLEPIGFAVTDAPGVDADAFDVVVPSFRPDTTTETDVAEEVARHFGYDRIVATVPSAARSGALTDRQQQRRRLRHLLADLGCAEAMPMPFLAPGDLERAGLAGGGLVITNPLAAEESVLRTSLRPGLLHSIAYNESHRRRDVALFEIGRVYVPGVAGDALPHEHERVSVILAGREAPAAVDFLVQLCGWTGTSYTLEAAALAGLHPGRGAKVSVDGALVGEVGEIHPSVLDNYGIGGRAAWLDLDLDAFLDRAAAASGSRRYVPVSRFPSSDIDLAFEVDDAVTVDAVASVLRRAAGELLVDLWLFDVFRGAPVAEGRRSLAFTLRLQAADRTLTDDEVAVVRAQHRRRAIGVARAFARLIEPEVPRYTYAGVVAAVRTPTANVLRVVAFATAALLLATSCGGTSANYVVNKPAQTYFKVPKDWDVTRLEPAGFSFLINDSIWADFFAPTGLVPDALQAPDKSPAPLGYVVIGQLEQNSYDAANDLQLRAISYVDEAGQPQYVDPLTLSTTQEDDVVRLIGIGRVARDGLRGYRMRYEIRAPGMPTMAVDETKMIHDATHTYYEFNVTCTVPCFQQYVGDINAIFESLRVRKDQP